MRTCTHVFIHTQTIHTFFSSGIFLFALSLATQQAWLEYSSCPKDSAFANTWPRSWLRNKYSCEPCVSLRQPPLTARHSVATSPVIGEGDWGVNNTDLDSNFMPKPLAHSFRLAEVFKTECMIKMLLHKDCSSPLERQICNLFLNSNPKVLWP